MIASCVAVGALSSLNVNRKHISFFDVGSVVARISHEAVTNIVKVHISPVLPDIQKRDAYLEFPRAAVVVLLTRAVLR